MASSGRQGQGPEEPAPGGATEPITLTDPDGAVTRVAPWSSWTREQVRAPGGEPALVTRLEQGQRLASLLVVELPGFGELHAARRAVQELTKRGFIVRPKPTLYGLQDPRAVRHPVLVWTLDEPRALVARGGFVIEGTGTDRRVSRIAPGLPTRALNLSEDGAQVFSDLSYDMWAARRESGEAGYRAALEALSVIDRQDKAHNLAHRCAAAGGWSDTAKYCLIYDAVRDGYRWRNAVVHGDAPAEESVLGAFQRIETHLLDIYLGMLALHAGIARAVDPHSIRRLRHEFSKRIDLFFWSPSLAV